LRESGYSEKEIEVSVSEMFAEWFKAKVNDCLTLTFVKNTACMQ